MAALRKALLSLGVTIFGLVIVFAIMAREMPGVYPGLMELSAFAREKLPRDEPRLSNLQMLRERSSPLPEEGVGLGAPIGGGTVYGVLDVFRMKEIFRPNDRPTVPLRTRPDQVGQGMKLPTVGETRKSNNSLLGSL